MCRAACVVLFRFLECPRHKNTPHKAVASRVKASGYFVKEPLEAIEEAIGHMEVQGRRYMLLERDLGEGACLMLCEDLSEPQ